MYDGKKIIPGLIIFFLEACAPTRSGTMREWKEPGIYVSQSPKLRLTRRSVWSPRITSVSTTRTCWTDWKESVVRKGGTIYVASNKKKYIDEPEPHLHELSHG